MKVGSEFSFSDWIDIHDQLIANNVKIQLTTYDVLCEF